MGNWQTRPKWDREYPRQWDEWGYVPPGSNPSQHLWSDFYSAGFASPDRVQGEYYPVLFGATDDLLQNFGTNAGAKVTTFHPTGQPQTAVSQYARLEQTAWDPLKDHGTCAPSNYPNCDMTKMANNTKFVPWNANAAEIQGDLSKTVWPNPGTASATVINPIDKYTESLDTLARHYASGGYDYLREINPTDTSDYDPCAGPGFFEILLPVGIGMAMVVATNRFGGAFLQTFPPAVQPVTTVCAFLFGFNYTRGALESILDPTSRDESFQDAATALTTAMLFAGGSVIGDAYSNNYAENPSDMYAPIGGALTTAVFLPRIQPTIYKVLKVSTLGGIMLGVVNVVIKGVSYFFCRMINWGADPCEDFEAHPRARRWDVASICARLTDIACEQENWSKNSPEAEFVFRALLTNPYWMYAANTTPAAENMYVKMTGTNPMGELVQTQTFNNNATYQAVPPNYQVPGFLNNFNEHKYSISGMALGGAYGSDKDTSYFACQNWDALFCGDNMAPGKCHTAGDVAQTSLLAKNMKEWLQSAIMKAYDPNNIRKMHQIPGIVNPKLKNRYEYDLTTYLRTCATDFDAGTGVGFDDVQSRGEWAQHYDVTKIPDSPQKTALLANGFFAEPNLYEAYEALVRSDWKEQDMIAWAHYIYRPYGDFGIVQEDDFVTRWAAQRDPRVDALLQETNPGFSANPWKHGGLTPLQPAPPYTPAPPVKTTPVVNKLWFDRAKQVEELWAGDEKQKAIDYIMIWTNGWNVSYTKTNAPPVIVAYFAVLVGSTQTQTDNDLVNWLLHKTVSYENDNIEEFFLHQMAYWMTRIGRTSQLTGNALEEFNTWKSYPFANTPGWGPYEEDPISPPDPLRHTFDPLHPVPGPDPLKHTFDPLNPHPPNDPMPRIEKYPFDPLEPHPPTDPMPILDPKSRNLQPVPRITPLHPVDEELWDTRAVQVEEYVAARDQSSATQLILSWTNNWDMVYVKQHVPPNVAAFFAVVWGISNSPTDNYLLQWILNNTLPYDGQYNNQYFLHQVAFWMKALDRTSNLSGESLNDWQIWYAYPFPNSPGFGPYGLKPIQPADPLQPVPGLTPLQPVPDPTPILPLPDPLQPVPGLTPLQPLPTPQPLHRTFDPLQPDPAQELWNQRARQVEQLTGNGQGIEAVSDILTWTNGWNVQFVNTNVPPAVAAYFAVVIGMSRTNTANALMQWVISNTMPYTPQEAQDYFLHQIAYWVGLIGNSEQLSGYWLQQWQTWNNYNFPKGPGF